MAYLGPFICLYKCIICLYFSEPVQFKRNNLNVLNVVLSSNLQTSITVSLFLYYHTLADQSLSELDNFYQNNPERNW